MKKLVILALSLVLVLVFLSFSACGGEKSTTQTASGNGSSTTTSAATSTAAAQSSGSGLTWNDMPVYAGAANVQKGSWAIPPSENEDYSKFEWRYYESNAAGADVSAFYKSKMPSIGWTEAAWMDIQGSSWGMYNKNDEKDAAMIWVSSQDKKTVIAMWRGTK